MAAGDQGPGRERTSALGCGALLLVTGFCAAVFFNLGGLGDTFGKLLAGELHSTAREAGPARSKAPGPPALPPDVTPAWFIDANGYEGAETERRAAHLDMVVYFHKRPCEECRRFEHEVLAAPEVKRFLQDVVKVRVDVGAGAREATLAQKLGAAGLPSVVAIRPDGSPRAIPITKVTAAQFVASLR